jgi:hypothetical protein
MFVRIPAAAACFAVAVLFALIASPVLGAGSDFESGVGHNGESVGTTQRGFAFSDGVCFTDINSGWYRFTSDTGRVTEDGEYFISGSAAAAVLNGAAQARIDFTRGIASYLTLGYSSQFALVLDAYDSAGHFLGSSTGTPNVLSSGGTGLAYLTVRGNAISYVLVSGDAGTWCMDNLTTDAPIPEPTPLITLTVALVALGSWRRRASTRT